MVYNLEYQKHCVNGDYFDVIFTNKKGEITEGAISNIFIEKKGKLYTPPIHCGLLNGIMRKQIIKKRKAKEKVLKIEDLVSAENIYLTNSVRGIMKVLPS
jgi:para-aminobenzoate synthetase/4-amino-4-deoxychorismate lyase